MKDKKIFIKRIFMSLAGVIVLAIAVGILKTAALGVDPFTTTVIGLDKAIPLQYGIIYIIYNVVLLTFSLIFNRKLIGIATFINLFLLGYITQFTQFLLIKVNAEPAIWLRIIYFIVAIVIMCYGSALYITADLGVSTYDAIALTMANKWKWGKFKFIRIITDCCCLIIGTGLYLLAKGTWKEVFSFVGAGTIILAFFMGPLVDFFNVHCAEPMLYGKNGKSTETVKTTAEEASKE